MEPLPRFLFANDMENEDVFIVHTQAPHFVARVVDGATGEELHPCWIPGAPPADLNAPEVLDAMHAATAFYRQTLDTARTARDTGQN